MKRRFPKDWPGEQEVEARFNLHHEGLILLDLEAEAMGLTRNQFVQAAVEYFLRYCVMRSEFDELLYVINHELGEAMKLAESLPDLHAKRRSSRFRRNRK